MISPRRNPGCGGIWPGTRASPGAAGARPRRSRLWTGSGARRSGGRLAAPQLGVSEPACPAASARRRTASASSSLRPLRARRRQAFLRVGTALAFQAQGRPRARSRGRRAVPLPLSPPRSSPGEALALQRRVAQPRPRLPGPRLRRTKRRLASAALELRREAPHGRDAGETKVSFSAGQLGEDARGSGTGACGSFGGASGRRRGDDVAHRAEGADTSPASAGRPATSDRLGRPLRGSIGSQMFKIFKAAAAS